MTTDLDAYRRLARAWARRHLPPKDGTAGARSGHHDHLATLAQDRASQRRIFEAGFMGIAVPAAYGGQGLTRRHEQAWREESAGFALPAPGGIASRVTLGIVLPTLLAHGSEPQKREWIPRMLSGDELWVQLLSEPGAGSDLAGVLTRATRDGDEWVISGAKIWSSGAMCADFGICLARTDWEASKHRGLTWFKVPLHDPRVTVRPVREINGSAEFCEEFLDDVVVRADAIIGELNEGWPIANTMLAVERRAGPAPGSSGRRPPADGLAPDLVALAAARSVTSDGWARQCIARAHINDFFQAQLTRRIAVAARSGKAHASAASLVKLGAGEVDPCRAGVAMELAGLGAVAFAGEASTGCAAATNFLNGRIMAIAGGTNEIQRNIISERILGLPREPSADTEKPFRDVLRDAKEWGQRR